MPMSYANALTAHFLHSPMSDDASRLPQTIAHRGYKGHYPENTICAIDKAIAAGTHALELDLHVSRDGVIVLSHVSISVSSRLAKYAHYRQDALLQRCFGVKKKVSECDWDYLQTLRTVEAPHEPMPRLVDVLDYLRQPGREHIWVLLDIKVRLR